MTLSCTNIKIKCKRRYKNTCYSQVDYKLFAMNIPSAETPETSLFAEIISSTSEINTSRHLAKIHDKSNIAVGFIAFRIILPYGLNPY